MQAQESVEQVSATSLHNFWERVRTRADTTLVSLSGAEFARGLSALEQAVAVEKVAAPVVDRLDLLVLG